MKISKTNLRRRGLRSLRKKLIILTSTDFHNLLNEYCEALVKLYKNVKKRRFGGNRFQNGLK